MHPGIAKAWFGVVRNGETGQRMVQKPTVFTAFSVPSLILCIPK